MKVTVSRGSLGNHRSKLLLVPLFEKGKQPFQTKAMKGEVSKLYLLYSGYKGNEMILGVGMGKKPTLEHVRAAFGLASKKVKDLKIANFSVLFQKIPGHADSAAAVAMMEGLLLGAYEFDTYKTKKMSLNTCTFLYPGSLTEEVNRTTAIAESVNMVRYMANENADVMTTTKIASIAKEIAKKNRLKIQILEKQQLQKLGMNLHLGVSAGSRYPPKLIIIHYRGNPKSKETTALIGKGITFDSGGLNLKPSGYIETMKQDMTGAASVLGIIQAVARLRLKVNLTVLAPTCENSIGSGAYKPGDIIRSYSGKTVEIENTDAEGRLILADAIAYAEKHLKPSQIITMGTLTGAAAIIFGEHVTPIMGNGKIKKPLVDASLAIHDRMWELPLYKEYKDAMKGDMSDLKNIGTSGRDAGTLKCGAFLAAFAEKTPFLHVDLGGTAWADKPHGYTPKFATGAGVRAFIECFRRLSRR